MSKTQNHIRKPLTTPLMRKELKDERMREIFRSVREAFGPMSFIREVGKHEVHPKNNDKMKSFTEWEIGVWETVGSYKVLHSSRFLDEVLRSAGILSRVEDRMRNFKEAKGLV